MPTDLAAAFRGQTALVTGASSGLGADMARQLAAAGARVLLVARSEPALDAVAAGIRAAGGEASVWVCDLEPPGAAAGLLQRVAEAGEPVDVLINNAGFGICAPLANTPAEAVDGQVALNVAAVTALSRGLLPQMLARRRGWILHVSSLAGFVPTPRYAVYSATKAYVLAFSQALWFETRGSGVHVSCVAPGPVRTGFGARAGVGDAFFRGSLPSAEVARAGLAGLARNRRVVVTGWTNKLQVFASRFTPRVVPIAVAAGRTKRSS